jgi:hypothetical protein
MPISYRIDVDRQRVLTRAWGVLTDDDILLHKARLLADPAFRPGMRQLSDISGIDRLAVTAAGVQAMVAHDAKHAARLQGSRLALVVPADASFGMARMYQSLGDGNAEGVGVFRTIAEAEAWLDATPSR